MAFKQKEFANEVIIPEIAKLLDEGHSVTLKLRGVSMRPFTEDGRDKAILTKPCSPLKVGDVVLAEVAPRRYALHRIVKIDGNSVVMRGDGNIATEQCDISKVFGIAHCFYRKGRKVPTILLAGNGDYIPLYGLHCCLCVGICWLAIECFMA